MIHVGSAQPCSQLSQVTTTFSAGKVNEGNFPLWNDVAALDVGRICPYNMQGEDENNTILTFRAVFELPYQTTIPTTGSPTYDLIGGLSDGSNLWSSSQAFDVDHDHNFAVESIGPFNEMEPFFAVFPRVEMEPIETNGAVFLIRYLIKLRPGTRGSFQFVISPGSTPGDKYRVCLLDVTHIGRNYPCLGKPSLVPVVTDNMVMQYGPDPAEESKECGESAQILFKGLTNWGKQAIDYQMDPDEDSIEVAAYFSTCQDTSDDGVNITHSLLDASDESEVAAGVTFYNTTSDEKLITVVNLTKVAYGTRTEVAKYHIFRNAPKIVRAIVSVPANFYSNITIRVKIARLQLIFMSVLDHQP